MKTNEKIKKLDGNEWKNKENEWKLMKNKNEWNIKINKRMKKIKNTK